MESNNLIAKAEAKIRAGVEKVWDALTNPEMIKQYMMGAMVNSNWTEGSSITWKGDFNGKPYEDKGWIIQSIPGKKLKYSHFSPLSGAEDKPENYHIVTIDLKQTENQVLVSLSQDKNKNEEEKGHSEKNWQMMLDKLKQILEAGI